jgi:hypothetical protein
MKRYKKRKPHKLRDIKEKKTCKGKKQKKKINKRTSGFVPVYTAVTEFYRISVLQSFFIRGRGAQETNHYRIVTA